MRSKCSCRRGGASRQSMNHGRWQGFWRMSCNHHRTLRLAWYYKETKMKQLTSEVLGDIPHMWATSKKIGNSPGISQGSHSSKSQAEKSWEKSWTIFDMSKNCGDPWLMVSATQQGSKYTPVKLQKGKGCSTNAPLRQNREVIRWCNSLTTPSN